MPIAYVPADLPKLPYSEEEYWNFFYKNNLADVTNSNRMLDYCLLTYTELSDEEKETGKDGFNNEEYTAYKYDVDRTWLWKDEIKQKLPKLVEFIEALPLRKLTFITMIANVNLVESHQDFAYRSWNGDSMKKFQKEIKGFEPASYRLLLAGNRTESFFVSPDETENNAICVTIPKETDTFFLNVADSYHGGFPTKQRKLMCFIAGFIDFEEHKKLLARSIDKFSEYIISF